MKCNMFSKQKTNATGNDAGSPKASSAKPGHI
jgi:hypothetical protein